MLLFGVALLVLPVGLALYAYVLYPALLWAFGRLPHFSGTDVTVLSDSMPPMVSIVVPAFNEAHQIRETIESLLAQNYPASRRQILVLSDASSDGTDDIVREYQSRGVELLRMPTRVGKTAAENASLTSIRGEIVVNTDASVRLHPDAVRSLVQAMADPAVGVASTRDVSTTADVHSNRAEGSYVGYEMKVRALETRCGGIVGASGSGYAIRTALHRIRVRDDLSRDFSAALIARRHGLRAVSVEGAVCYVPRSASRSHEYRRKVRTISRGMETLYFNRDLLDPVQHGAFALKLLSHKVVRWLVPLAALPALAGLWLLAMVVDWMIYPALFAAAMGSFAIAGARWPDSRPLPRWLPASLLGIVAANLAVMHSTWRFFHGHQDHVWEPTRRPAPST